MKKALYLWLVGLSSWLARWRQSQQVIYLLSFDGNLAFIQALAARVGDQLVVYYQGSAKQTAQQLQTAGIKTVPFADSFSFALRGVPVITAAPIVYCDNYFAFLAGIHARANQRVIQLWHAAGAIKCFGWEDPTTSQRSWSDRRRFQKVYNHFTDFVVGSPKMGQVFAHSYHVNPNKMQVLGYPRSDRLFDPDWYQTTRQRIWAKYPELQMRELVLYVPTYRQGVDFELPQDIDQLQLQPNQVLVLKLHPHLAATTKAWIEKYPHLLMTVPEFSTDELLTVTDRLITDYSSVIFDYSLLPNCHQMLFWLYDWENYQHTVGVQADFLRWIPGSIAHDTTELQQLLQTQLPKAAPAITRFNGLWNSLNDGQATERVLAHFHH